VTFWDAWEKMCNKKDLNFGATTTGSFITTHPPTRPWKPEFATSNNMVIVPHAPYSPDLATCDFAFFFSKLKLKLKGWHFESVWHHRGYLTALRKMTSTVLLKHGKKWWDCCIYTPKETILKEMEAKIE
jgi:hypothetical protein